MGREHRISDGALVDLDQPVRARPVEPQAPAIGHQRDASPIAPGVGRGAYRPHVDVVDAAQARKLLAHDRGLGGPLGFGRDLLPLASAAGPEHRAAWRHAVRAGRHHLAQLGAQPVAPALHHGGPDAIAGRGQGDEHHAAIVARDGVAAKGEALYRQVERPVVVRGAHRGTVAGGDRSRKASPRTTRGRRDRMCEPNVIRRPPDGDHAALRGRPAPAARPADRSDGATSPGSGERRCAHRTLPPAHPGRSQPRRVRRGDD